jgi:hypothetical protein
MVIFSQVDFQKWKDEDDSDNEEQVQYRYSIAFRIRNPVYESKDPDPYQNATDPEHRYSFRQGFCIY